MAFHEGFLEKITAVSWGGAQVDANIVLAGVGGGDVYSVAFLPAEGGVWGSTQPLSFFQKLHTGVDSGETADARLMPDPSIALPQMYTYLNNRAASPGRLSPMRKPDGSLVVQADRPYFGYNLTQTKGFFGADDDFRFLGQAVPSMTDYTHPINRSVGSGSGTVTVEFRSQGTTLLGYAETYTFSRFVDTTVIPSDTNSVQSFMQAWASALTSNLSSLNGSYNSTTGAVDLSQGVDGVPFLTNDGSEINQTAGSSVLSFNVPLAGNGTIASQPTLPTWINQELVTLTDPE